MQRREARSEGSLEFSLGPRCGVTGFGGKRKFSVIIWLLQGATPRRQGSPWLLSLPSLTPSIVHHSASIRPWPLVPGTRDSFHAV